jgi:hypothetical protein
MSQPETIVFTAPSGPITATHYVIYPGRRRSWRERLFSLPWRPWRKWAPIAGTL